MTEDAIMRLKKTDMFQLLLSKEQLLCDDHEISEKVVAIARHVVPLLERIPENLPEFTLHDPNHSAKLVELMPKIIPGDTLDALNAVELSILVYSAYLHDIGMAANRSEREAVVTNSVEYQMLLASDPTLEQAIKKLKEDGDYRSATFLEDQIFAEYLRKNHVQRSSQFINVHLINEGLAIQWRDASYHKWVQAVCDSHGLDVDSLRDTDKWPRDTLVRNARVNVQYLSLALRMADILDLDPERTPSSLLRFIDPTNNKSIVEWRKHRDRGVTINGTKSNAKDFLPQPSILIKGAFRYTQSIVNLFGHPFNFLRYWRSATSTPKGTDRF